MMRSIILSIVLFACSLAHAQGLTPILMSDGNARIACDGTQRYMNNVLLTNKTIVKSYLFGNLITAPGYGADIVIWSPAYGGWGTIGDLHMFPHTMGGGRQGERETNFSPDGMFIASNQVYLIVSCWGGGTLELYAQIWVK